MLAAVKGSRLHRKPAGSRQTGRGVVGRALLSACLFVGGAGAAWGRRRLLPGSRLVSRAPERPGLFRVGAFYLKLRA